jgi:hypothetical protein
MEKKALLLLTETGIKGLNWRWWATRGLTAYQKSGDIPLK